MTAIQVNFRDFYHIAPEILLTAWGILLLIVDIGWLRGASSARRRVGLGWIALLGTVATAAYILGPTLFGSFGGPDAAGAAFGPDPDPLIFFGTLAGDLATRRLNLVVTLMLGLVVGLSMSWSFTEHWGEYYALLFWAAVGMMFLIAAEELLTLFLTLEMMTLCLYLATALEKGRRRSAEGGLKYFVYGSVSSALFLFGLSLIYGLTGTTSIEGIGQAIRADVGSADMVGLEGNVAGATAVLLVLVGFGFKVAAVPFHQWAPDAYEGAPAPVTAWIASGSKIASFVALMKVLIHGMGAWARQPSGLLSPGWIGLVALIAAVTMTYGNFAALGQRNLKRMLAYSSIAHAGYLLVGVLAAVVSTRGVAGRATWNAMAAGSVLFYLVIYGAGTIGAFSLAAWLSRDFGREDIEDLNGLGARSPGLSLCIVVLMLSLIGMPPLAGFFGKLTMFMEALNAGERGRLALTWLVALGLANSVVSAFYYVRILKAMYLRPSRAGSFAPASRAIAWPIVASTLVVVAFGLYPSPLLESMNQAAIPMLTPRPGGANFEATRTVEAPPVGALPGLAATGR